MDTALAFARYAWTAHLVGDDENADRAFRIARKKKRSAEVNELYACWLARTGKLDVASHELRRLSRSHPNIRVFCCLAEVALKRGDLALCLKAIERAVAYDPEYTTSWGTKARVLALDLKKRLAAARGQS